MGDRMKISEQAVEALNQAKSNQQELAWMRRQLIRQRQILRALWGLAGAKLGIPEEELLRAVERLDAEEKNQPRVADLCPECGRSLQENRNLCIYCGFEVKRRELF